MGKSKFLVRRLPNRKSPIRRGKPWMAQKRRTVTEIISRLNIPQSFVAEYALGASDMKQRILEILAAQPEPGK